MTEAQIWIGVFTGIVGFLGFLIAYRQWRTAQNKLKLELFERRLEIYEAVDALLVSYMTRFGDREKSEREFNTALRSSRWLFDKKVVEFCRTQIWPAVCDMNDKWEEVDELRKSLALGHDLEKSKLKDEKIKKIIDQKKKLSSFRAEWENLVTPYMSLRFK